VITPDDLRNPSRKSGYNGVRKSVGPKPYQANKRVAAGKNGILTIGTRRATARQAAQDLCDYLNNNAQSAPSGLKRAAHPKAKRKQLTAAQQVALDILRDARAKPKAMGWVYLVVEQHPGAWKPSEWVAKVGWTSKNPPEARLNDYQAGNPRKLVMIGKIKGTKRKESNIHKRHIDKNVLGEWFRLDDALLSEFNLKQEDIT
jgi:hypothetical protein